MKHFYISIREVFSLVFILLTGIVSFAQVGIGTETPNEHAILDVFSNSSSPGGLLMPRVALQNTSGASPLGEHVAGMTVYNTASTDDVTPGFYFNDGSRWVRIAADSGPQPEGWLLSGNSGTNSNNHFLGTTDNQPLRIRTNNFNRFQITSGNATAGGRLLAYADGAAATPIYSWQSNPNMGMYRIDNGILGFATNGAERIRIISNGRVGINTGTNLWGNTTLTTFAMGTNDDAIAGSSSSGLGLYGQSLNYVGVHGLVVNPQASAGVVGSTTANSLGDGVWGLANNGQDGIYGQKSLGAGNGVFGNSSNVGVRGYGAHGAFLESGLHDGYGVIAWNTAASGNGRIGLVAAGQNLDLRSLAGSGATFTGLSSGAASFAASANGTGIQGAGNNEITVYTANNGAGVAGTGSYVGTFGTSTRAGDGIGIVGVGNATQTYTLPPTISGTGGAGVAGTGTKIGVFGHAVDNNGYGVYSSGNLHATGTITSDQPIIAPRGIITDVFVVDENGMTVDGSLMAQSITAAGDLMASGTKNFIIDHPNDPANKYLKHASVESNEILNLYRGTATFNAFGEAVIDLPDYYDAINRNPSYQLTPIGAAMPNLFIAEEVNHGRFMIAGGEPGKKVSWTITAERNDVYLQRNPQIRDMVVDKGENRGKYLIPEVYGRGAKSEIMKHKLAEIKAGYPENNISEEQRSVSAKESEIQKYSREEVEGLIAPLKEVKNTETIKKLQNSYKSHVNSNSSELSSDYPGESEASLNKIQEEVGSSEELQSPAFDKLKERN